MPDVNRYLRFFPIKRIVFYRITIEGRAACYFKACFCRSLKQNRFVMF